MTLCERALTTNNYINNQSVPATFFGHCCVVLKNTILLKKQSTPNNDILYLGGHSKMFPITATTKNRFGQIHTLDQF